MSTPTKVSGNMSFPATALLVSPPKTIALPSVVLSPRSPNGSNVGPPLPLSPDKMCMGNNLSAHDHVRPSSRNSDPSTALNCPDPSQCDTKVLTDSSTSCSGLVTVETKPGSAVCERTRSKLAAKKQIEARASPVLKPQAVPPASQKNSTCVSLKLPLGSPLATDECADLVAAPVSESLPLGTSTTAGNLPHVVPCPEEKSDKDACLEAHPAAPQCPDELPNFSLGSLGLPNRSSEGSPVMAQSPPTTLEDQLFLSPSPEKQDVQEVVTLSDSPLAKVPDLPSEWTKMFLGLLSGPPPAKAFASLPPVAKSTCKYCELVLSSPVSLKLHLEEVHPIRSPTKSAAPEVPTRSNPAMRLLPQFVYPPELASSPAKPKRPATSTSNQSVSKSGSLSYAAATSRKLPANPPPRPAFQCPRCLAFFSMRSAYVLHKCPKSPAASSAPGDTSSRFCCDCKILFVNKKALREHNYNIHNPLRPAQPSVPVAKAAPPTQQPKTADRSNSSSCVRNLSGALGVSTPSTPNKAISI
ncbi:proteoglycan 4-like [Argiope bruennichi]|uniref:proteoglycan 4-like n=1 Tax=Argiope bruennichi TaxID=94029 RepID=UPI00249567A7|nr:proteoglycan 4-like [Argiope bruennichi]